MSKTCGECRFYFEQAEFCRKNAWECIEEDKECCDEFEKPTNGDKIRQMSNEKLVDTIDELAFKFSTRRAFLAYLNAPANCVKQNGKSAKQADLCCKSAKESEVEDE